MSIPDLFNMKKHCSMLVVSFPIQSYGNVSEFANLFTPRLSLFNLQIESLNPKLTK